MPLLKPQLLLLILVPLIVLSPMLAISFGSADIAPADVGRAVANALFGADAANLSQRIIIELRLPRVLLASFLLHTDNTRVLRSEGGLGH